MDNRAEHALELFDQIMWTAVADASLDSFPNSKDVRRAHDQMTLILNRVAEYFRSRVGLREANSATLIDVELLGATRLINTSHFAEFNMPTKGILSFKDDLSAEEIVKTAHENVNVLRSELTALRQAASSKRFFYSIVTDVDRYLRELQRVKSQK